MFLPIGDAPNPRGFTPYVNWALIAVNVAVYLFLTLPMSTQPLDLSNPAHVDYLRFLTTRLQQPVPFEVLAQSVNVWDVFVFEHGYKPGAASVTDLFSGMFMHAGFAHLGGNMLFLWIYGDNVEHHIGRLKYLVLYIVTGVIATVSFAAFAGDSIVPLVGASGAISGVLGLYFILFPRNVVKVFIFFFPFIMNVVPIPARIVLGLYIVVQNIFPALLASSGSGGVAYGAHIGGFVGGLVIAWVGERFGWSFSAVQERRQAFGRPSRASVKAAPSFQTVEDQLKAAVARRDRKEAFALLRTLPIPEVARSLPAETVILAQWLADDGEPIAAQHLLRQAMGARSSQLNQARVYLTLGLIRLQQGQPTAAYQHLLSVFDFNPDEETKEKAKAALASIGGPIRRN